MPGLRRACNTATTRCGFSPALTEKWNQGANGGQNFGSHPAGGIETVRAKFPNLVEGQNGLPDESRIRS